MSMGPFRSAPHSQPAIAIVEGPLLRRSNHLGPNSSASPVFRHDKTPELRKSVGLHPDCAEYVNPADELVLRRLGDQHPVACRCQHTLQSIRGLGDGIGVAELGGQRANC